MDEQTKQCMRDVQECQNTCLATITYCLLLGEEYVKAPHIIALVDCAEACQTGANLMLRSSQLQAQMRAVCVEACEEVARYCNQFAQDTRMQACADSCRRAAQSCRLMAAAIGSEESSRIEDATAFQGALPNL